MLSKNNPLQLNFTRLWNYSIPNVALRLTDALGNSYPARRFFRPTILRTIGFRIGQECQIWSGLTFRYQCNDIDIRSAVKFGSHSKIDSNVTFVQGIYNSDQTPDILTPTVICDYAWLSANSTILHGTTIGKGTVIEPITKVVKDVPSHILLGGAPAKVILREV